MRKKVTEGEGFSEEVTSELRPQLQPAMERMGGRAFKAEGAVSAKVL